MNYTRFRITFILCLILDASNLFAASISKEAIRFKLAEKNETLSELIEKNEFKPLESLNFGYQDKTLWLKITPPQNSDATILTIDYPLLHEVDLYERIETNLVLSPGGISQLTNSSKFFLGPSFVLKKPRQVFYIKISSLSSIPIDILLETPEAYQERTQQKLWLLGIFYGSVLLLVFYTSIISLYFKSSLTAIYGAYLVFYAIFQLGGNGLLFTAANFVPNHWLIKLHVASGLLSIFFFAWFSEWYLSFTYKTKSEYFYRLLRLATVIVAISVLFILTPFHYKALALLGVFFSIFCLVMGIKAVAKKLDGALIFSLAFSLFLASAILFGLQAGGVVERNVFTKNIFQIGSLSQAFLLSFAIAYRFDRLRRDNLRLSKNLTASEIAIENSNKEKSDLKKQVEKAQDQLTQAEKLTIIGQLIADVAHDIAAPSQLIANLGYELEENLIEEQKMIAALFDDTNDPDAIAIFENFKERHQENLKRLSDLSLANERIVSLQSALRNQTRYEKQLSTFAVHDLINESLVILASKLKKIHTKLESNTELFITANRSELAQVINNLISNAADSVENLSHSRLIIRSKLDDRNCLVLEVEDDGPGIKPEEAIKLFEAYYTTKALGKGTGLGLSIVEKIVRKHGGIIDIKPPIELSGARFCIKLPQ